MITSSPFGLLPQETLDSILYWAANFAMRFNCSLVCKQWHGRMLTAAKARDGDVLALFIKCIPHCLQETHPAKNSPLFEKIISEMIPESFRNISLCRQLEYKLPFFEVRQALFDLLRQAFSPQQIDRLKPILTEEPKALDDFFPTAHLCYSALNRAPENVETQIQILQGLEKAQQVNTLALFLKKCPGLPISGIKSILTALGPERSFQLLSKLPQETESLQKPLVVHQVLSHFDRYTPDQLLTFPCDRNFLLLGIVQGFLQNNSPDSALKYGHFISEKRMQIEAYFKIALYYVHEEDALSTMHLISLIEPEHQFNPLNELISQLILDKKPQAARLFTKYVENALTREAYLASIALQFCEQSAFEDASEVITQISLPNQRSNLIDQLIRLCTTSGRFHETFSLLQRIGNISEETCRIFTIAYMQQESKNPDPDLIKAILSELALQHRAPFLHDLCSEVMRNNPSLLYAQKVERIALKADQYLSNRSEIESFRRIFLIRVAFRYANVLLYSSAIQIIADLEISQPASDRILYNLGIRTLLREDCKGASFFADKIISLRMREELKARIQKNL